MILTTHGVTSLESIEDFWVHVDHEIFLFCKPLVACLYLVCYPLAKVISNKGIANVNNPLSRAFWEFLFVWKVVKNNWVIIHELPNLAKRQTFILRNVEMPKVGIVDIYE